MRHPKTLVGIEIGSYRLISVIREHSSGIAFLAKSSTSGQACTVELLIPPTSGTSLALGNWLEHLRRRMPVLSSLSHESILPVETWGEQQGFVYVVLPPSSGIPTLWEALQQFGTIPLEDIRLIAHQLASALDYAHARGIAYGHLLPENILLRPEKRVLITDFSIGPEPDDAQAYAQAVQRDRQRLGELLYLMATGHEPDVSPVPPRLLNPSLAADLESFLLCAVDKDEPLHVESARAVADLLDLALSPSPNSLSADTGVGPGTLLVGSTVRTHRNLERLDEAAIRDALAALTVESRSIVMPLLQAPITPLLTRAARQEIDTSSAAPSSASEERRASISSVTIPLSLAIPPSTWTQSVSQIVLPLTTVVVLIILFSTAQLLSSQAPVPGDATPAFHPTLLLADPLTTNTHHWRGSRETFFADGALHLTNVSPAPLEVLWPLQAQRLPILYQLTIRQVRGQESARDNAFGMLLRYQKRNVQGRSQQSGYSFEVATGAHEYYFWKYDESQVRAGESTSSAWTLLWSRDTGSEFAGAQAHNELAVQAVGPTFTFIVNGVRVGTVQDTAFQSGSLGVSVTAGTEIACSRLEIWRV